MGSFLLREYLATGPTLIGGAIIVGTGIQSNIILRGLECIVSGEINKVGFDNGSAFIDNLSFGQYNKSIKDFVSPYDWLCSDYDSIEEYVKDDLSKKHISAGLFLQLLQSMRRTNDHKQYRKWNERISVLIISGDEDPVGNNGKGATGLCDQLVSCKFNNIQLEILPGRHDVFHEYKNDTASKVVDYIISFILG